MIECVVAWVAGEVKPGDRVVAATTNTGRRLSLDGEVLEIYFSWSEFMGIGPLIRFASFTGGIRQILIAGDVSGIDVGWTLEAVP